MITQFIEQWADEKENFQEKLTVQVAPRHGRILNCNKQMTSSRPALSNENTWTIYVVYNFLVATFKKVKIGEKNGYFYLTQYT